MPMHPECRQQDLEKQGFNAAISMFLPMTAMEGKQEYMRRYYEPELEAEQEAELEQQFQGLLDDWQARRRQAEAAGRIFEEPIPRYPEPPEKPEAWWERLLLGPLLWLDDLPGGKYITIALIAVGALLTFWLILPIYMVYVQRKWRAMLRRDREYQGDAPCDHCGARFRGSPRRPGGGGGGLPGH